MNGISLPAGRKGQALAFAMLVSLLLLLYLGLVSPLADWYAQRGEEIDRQQAQLEHLSAVAAHLPALETQRAANAADNAADVQGATDARAGADLQQRIEGMAGAAGAHLASVEFLPPEQADGYRRIPLRVSISTRWPVLVALMAAIETASPPLLIDDFHVRSAGSEGDPTPSADASFVVIILRTVPLRGTEAPL
jgi:general secretion pathway protein M